MTSPLTPSEAHELRVLNLLDELYGKLYAISYNARLDPTGTRYGTVAKMIEHYEHELVNGHSTSHHHDESPDDGPEQVARPAAGVVLRSRRRQFSRAIPSPLHRHA